MLMRIGVLILPDTSWSENLARWRAVEAMGFDSAWTYDHIWWRGLRDESWFSAVPVLAAAAACTTRVRIGLMVASPNFRHPVLTAKDAIAIDDISCGRFVLGVGSGAPSAGDAEVLGGAPLSPAERGVRFREFVELTRTLLDEPVTTVAGRFYSATQARMIPGPVQRPRLPLGVAASGPAGIALAARRGDAWITAGPANWTGGHTARECLDVVRRQVLRLRRECDAIGRDPSTVERIFIATPMCGDPLSSARACSDIAEAYAEAGMTQMVIHWPRPHGVYAGDPEVLRDIVTEVVPRLAGATARARPAHHPSTDGAPGDPRASE